MVEAVETGRVPRDPGYVAAVLLVIGGVMLGVLGYQLGFLGFVYRLMLPDAFSRVDVMTLAAVMGVAAFFSPCAFPLLPGYMTYHIAAQYGERRLLRSLYLGFFGALGLVTVNVAIGLVIAALGAAAPFNPDPRQDPWVVLAPRLIGGLFVTYLGAMYVLDKELSLGPLGRLGGLVRLDQTPGKRPAWNTFLYGVLYNVIGIGCTGALLLGLVLYTLSVGQFWTAFIAFAVFSGTMGILMIAVTLLVGLTQATLIKGLRANLPVIRRVSGTVMLIVGALTVAFVLQGNQLFTKLFFPFFQ